MHYALTKRFCIFHHCGLNANKNQRLIANIMREANETSMHYTLMHIKGFKKINQ